MIKLYSVFILSLLVCNSSGQTYNNLWVNIGMGHSGELFQSKLSSAEPVFLKTTTFLVGLDHAMTQNKKVGFGIGYNEIGSASQLNPPRGVLASPISLVNTTGQLLITSLVQWQHARYQRWSFQFNYHLGYMFNSLQTVSIRKKNGEITEVTKTFLGQFSHALSASVYYRCISYKQAEWYAFCNFTNTAIQVVHAPNLYYGINIGLMLRFKEIGEK